MDSITKEPLSEVIFKVTTPAGVPVGSSNGEFVTDSRGYISITDIEPDTYIVEEVQTKSGYVLDRTPKTITIKDHQAYTLEVYNQKKGQLVVYKIDSVTKEPLQGVEFEITTADGSKVATDEGLTSTNGRYVTNEKDQIVLDKLMPDTYVVTKTKTIDGYRLDAPSRTVVIGKGDTQTLTFTNTPMGGLLIKKTNSLTREPLAGVEFKITTASGELVATNEGLTSSNGIYTTNDSGEIVLEKLVPGTYIVTETKSLDGYMIDAQPQTVVIGEGDTQTLTFTNTPGASLVIKKIDSKTCKPISGVEFEVKGLASVDYPQGSYITDVNGMIRLDGIPMGAYTVCETRVKDGYQLDNTPQTIQINAGETKELTFENDPLGSLTVTVKDANTREPLAGVVVVKITTLDGTIVGPSNGEYTTDNNGTIVINDIASGGYIIQEIRTLNGYILDDTPKTIEINDMKNYLVEILNHRKGGLFIRKVDAKTKEPLAGVEFKITRV